jgi:hypothetical protein
MPSKNVSQTLGAKSVEWSAIMEEDKIRWKQIVATALISGTVTLITGSTLFFFQRREPQLTYSVTSGLPFEGTQEKVAVYELRVSNDGNQMLKDVIASGL